MLAGCTVQVMPPADCDTTCAQMPPETVRVAIRDTLLLRDTIEVVKRETTLVRDTIEVVRPETTLVRDTVVFLLPADTVVVRDTVALPIPDSILQALTAPRCGTLLHSKLPLDAPAWMVSWDRGYLYVTIQDTVYQVSIWDVDCSVIEKQLQEKVVVPCDTVCW